MDTFEEFAAYVARVADRFPKSWFTQRRCWSERRRRMRENRPLPFKWVGYEGERVGEPIMVPHCTTHDQMPHAVRGVLTDMVLLNGARINAFQNLETHLHDGHWGESIIQPRWIDCAQ